MYKPIVMSLLNHRRCLASIAQSSFEASHINNNISSFVELSRLYCSYIQECIDNKSLANFRIIHARILKIGLLLGFYVGNKLTDGYLKCGNIASARKLFDELPQRSIITWNSMMSHYVSHRKCRDALLLFPKMVYEGVLPDRFTFLSIFKAFSELGLLKEGKKAHGVSVVLGFEVMDMFVGSSIVDMYAKFGKMKEAQLVVDRVLDKDVVLFTALIVGYTQRGYCAQALECFGDMISEGIKANEYTFASVLISCGDLGDLRVGMLIHGLIVKSGFESVVGSQTSLLTMYARCGLVNDCLKIFNSFSHPSQVMWTSVIVGLAHNGREESSLEKFKEMIRSSTIPNSFTLSCIIQACSRLAVLEGGKQSHALIVKLGLERDIYAGAALVDFYGKCGSTEMARHVFDELAELDLASTNSMIYSYAQSGYGHEAIALFNEMKVNGLEPNEVTVLSVLLACNNAGLIEEGCGIFASIKRDRSFLLTNDHYACMVSLLGRCGRLEEAESLVNEVTNPDVVLWRTLVSVCRLHGEVEIAERALSRLRYLSPEDGAAHVLMTNLYASTGNWGKVVEMKRRMRKMKVKKDPGVSWVEIDKEVHTFMAGDCSHPSSKEVFETLEGLVEILRDLGYVPDTTFVLQNFEEDNKIRLLVSS